MPVGGRLKSGCAGGEMRRMRLARGADRQECSEIGAEKRFKKYRIIFGGR
jgi:hypothetical protein